MVRPIYPILDITQHGQTPHAPVVRVKRNIGRRISSATPDTIHLAKAFDRKTMANMLSGLTPPITALTLDPKLHVPDGKGGTFFDLMSVGKKCLVRWVPGYDHLWQYENFDVKLAENGQPEALNSTNIQGLEGPGSSTTVHFVDSETIGEFYAHPRVMRNPLWGEFEDAPAGAIWFEDLLWGWIKSINIPPFPTTRSTLAITGHATSMAREWSAMARWPFADGNNIQTSGLDKQFGRTWHGRASWLESLGFAPVVRLLFNVFMVEPPSEDRVVVVGHNSANTDQTPDMVQLLEDWV